MLITLKEWVERNAKGRIEAAPTSDILYLLGQGNYILERER